MTESRNFALGDPYGSYVSGGERKEYFDEATALAILLSQQVCFLNSHWWEEEWPQRAKDGICVIVNCNDLFAWACADGEELPYDEIQNLYDLWKSDPYGVDKWCCIRRNQQPQEPIVKRMKAAGAWDSVMESLGTNTQDAEVQALFSRFAAARASHSNTGAGE